jgi:hypothetical protein
LLLVARRPFVFIIYSSTTSNHHDQELHIIHTMVLTEYSCDGSSAIERVAYNFKKKELVVKYRENNEIYLYFNVNSSCAKQLSRTSQSIGEVIAKVRESCACRKVNSFPINVRMNINTSTHLPTGCGAADESATQELSMLSAGGGVMRTGSATPFAPSVVNHNHKKQQQEQNQNQSDTGQPQQQQQQQQVLVIEGCSLFLGEDPVGEQLLTGHDGHSQSLWKDCVLTRTDFDFGEDRGKIDCIKEQLRSGRFTSVIVSNLSQMSNSNHVQKFVRCIGPSLKAFVYQGGYIAFPTAELAVILDPVINSIFGTTWVFHSYTRDHISPNITGSSMGVCHKYFPTFMKMKQRPFSAKSIFIQNVPEHEHCFGISGSGAVSVAVHCQGPNSGSIAVFGDVNFEVSTCDLVADFIHSRQHHHHSQEGTTSLSAFDTVLEEALVPSLATQHACGACHKPNASRKCSACKEERYCSEVCQKKNWARHRLVCGKTVEELSAGWKKVSKKNRQLIYSTVFVKESLNEFKDAMIQRAEEAMQAIEENNLSELANLLPLLNTDTTTDDGRDQYMLRDDSGPLEGVPLLHFAAEQEPEVVAGAMEVLLRHGADVNEEDINGDTVFDVLLGNYDAFSDLSVKGHFKRAADLLKRYRYKLVNGQKWGDFSSGRPRSHRR